MLSGVESGLVTMKLALAKMRTEVQLNESGQGQVTWELRVIGSLLHCFMK